MDDAAPDDAFRLVGTVLERKYRVDRKVAEGGFGVVYAGHQLRLDIPVALKLLKPDRVANPESRAEVVSRFLEEARTTAKLRHPNIAQVLDSGLLHTDEFPEGVPWMVLEWIDGPTLEAELAARRGSGGRTPREAFRLLSPVIDAIAHAHEHGIAHRDLKPSNVMLARSRGQIVPRVVDFGIAKLIDDPSDTGSGNTSTQSKFVAFSPGYAAPEQVARSRTGLWTDVHALGLMLSELLTDLPPYRASEDGTLLASVVDRQRPTPARAGVDVGPWEAVLGRALSLGSRERYSNAGELLRALETTLEAAEAARTSAHSLREPSLPIAAPSPMRISIADALPDDVSMPASSTVPYSRAVIRRRPAGLVFAALVAGLIVLGLIATRWLPTGSGELDTAPAASLDSEPPASELSAPFASVSPPAPDPAVPRTASSSTAVAPPASVSRPRSLSGAATPPAPPVPTRVTPTTRFE